MPFRNVHFLVCHLYFKAENINGFAIMCKGGIKMAIIILIIILIAMCYMSISNDKRAEKKEQRKQVAIQKNMDITEVILSEIETVYNIIVSHSHVFDGSAFVWLVKPTGCDNFKVEISTTLGTFGEEVYNLFENWEIGLDESEYSNDVKIQIFKFFSFNYVGTWEYFKTFFWSVVKERHPDWSIREGNILQISQD